MKKIVILYIFISISLNGNTYAAFYSAPFFDKDPWRNAYCGPQPTVSAALQCMVQGVAARYGAWTSSCTYQVKYFPDGPATGKFAYYHFFNGCSGGSYILSTQYAGDPPLKSGGPGCGYSGSNESAPDTMDGNPCDASTGNKFQIELDYSSNTLNFVRYYNSLYPSQSVLGKQWTHNFLTYLTISDTIQVTRSDNKVIGFQNISGSWVSDADITEILTQVGTLWEYKTNQDIIETYNAVGQLQSIKNRDGKITQYSYYDDGLLKQVISPFGRTLDFAYDTSGRLKTLTTPDGTEIHYGYDNATNNLISVTYPDDTPSDLTDNPKKTYHYEHPMYPHHLTGITDENGKRYATWDYNDNGLAILSEHANGSEKVQLAYNTDETSTVTDALGRVKTYTFEPHFGLRKPKTIEYKYHDGNELVTKFKTFTYYPETGRVKEVTDYNGNTTYYEYNDRGLVNLETRAKGKPEEYTVTTTWHLDYRLPATREYPDRTETYTYENGLLTKTDISPKP